MNDLLKKAIAEFIGTFVLVFFACGVAAITGGAIVATALAFGLVIIAMAYSIGRISGCHINPAVSLGCLLSKRMTLKEFLVYVCAQILGGFVGGLVFFGICKLAGYNLVGNACNMAITGELSAKTIFASIFLEVILTFVFVYVILNVTSKTASNGQFAGIIIGLTLTLVHLVGIALTGTSVNPARSLATALNDLIYNGGTESLKHVWIFIVAPLCGGALASLVYNLLHKETKEDNTEE